MIVIRKPLQKDLGKIRNILSQWNDEADTEKYLSRIKNEIAGINEFNMKFWIAFDKEALGVIGLSDLSPDLNNFSKTNEPGQLKILYVDNEERGRGVGKMLTEYLERVAKRQGYKELIVKSAEIYKDTAWGFYERMKYKPLGFVDNKTHDGKSKTFGKMLD